ncbi:hypothetical protein [Legionella sp.]|uniref:hypothetical protein n=1 Tax=Legionella sp. TaxID=459 RepID=UPI003C918ED8
MAVDKNNNTEILLKLFANFQPHLNQLTQVQQRLLKVLIDHPDGISSQDFTHLTSVLNKSDVLDKKLKLILAIEHIKLDVRRKGKNYYWSLKPVSSIEENRA